MIGRLCRKEDSVVTDQLSGLRFDIYERVNLPDDVAAIEELEEIELVPHMQALPQDDHVLLRGHLLLSGVYRSQQTRSESQLEHWIPVEISLPLNRIGKVEDLAVEIDNFDVDLISSRTLNVTGVLALRGLQVSSAQAPVWRDDSFTVVHQAQPELEPEPEEYTEQVPQQERFQSQDELTVHEPYSAVADSYAGPQSEAPNDFERADQSAAEEQPSPPQEAEKPNGWLSMFPNNEPQTKEKETEYRSADNQEETPSAEYSDYEIDHRTEDTEQAMDEEEAAAWAAVEADLKQRPEERPEYAFELFQEEKPQQKLDRPEEKPELKLPAAVKPVDTVIRIQSGVGLLSQLGENGAKREAELREQEAAETEQKAAAQNSASPTTGDELEWTRLFLSYGAEANTFKKLKICIVQREETLDAIANRYNVQPRELQLYNRLHDPYLSEGQVLYIPLAR
jgi:stage VI sporulation protein D